MNLCATNTARSQDKCVCYLMKACVLHMVGCHLFLSLDLHTDLKTNGTRHCWFVCSLLCRTHTHTHRLNYSERIHRSELNLRWTAKLRWQLHQCYFANEQNTLMHKCWLYTHLPHRHRYIQLCFSYCHDTEWAQCCTYPGCTTRPSPRSVSGPLWCSDPRSRQTPSSDAVSLATWCHHLHPKRAAWYDLMSCGTRCGDRLGGCFDIYVRAK